MIEKTVRFILKDEKFKVIGCSRTDAKVSAEESYFELFLQNPLPSDDFLEQLNYYLPSDIRALTISETDETFNIIQNPKMKEYAYYFCYGEKMHPFCAPIMAYFRDPLDIDLMKQGAKLFEGEHHWGSYCVKPSENSQFVRTVEKSTIEVNTEYTANFFPKNSFVYRVRSNGFMRYQIRLMMAQLVRLGRKDCTLEELERTLVEKPEGVFNDIAPGSGLVLKSVEFE